MTYTLVTGSGHCGTMWLAHVLDAQEHMLAYHEARQKCLNMNWQIAAQYAPGHMLNRGYFETMRWHAEHEWDVADCNSWAPFEAPGVNRRLAVDRVIYLTRDPVRQLDSLVRWSPVWSQLELHSFIGDVWLRRLWQVWQRYNASRREFEGWTREERLVLLVAANEFMPRWLGEEGMAPEVYSLEQLTTDVAALGRVAPELDEDELAQWQEQKINSKVRQEMTTDEILASWPQPLRRAFERMCMEVAA